MLPLIALSGLDIVPRLRYKISVKPAELAVEHEVHERIAGLAVSEAALTVGNGRVSISVVPIYTSTLVKAGSSHV